MVLTKKQFMDRYYADKKAKEIKIARDIDACVARRMAKAKALGNYYKCH